MDEDAMEMEMQISADAAESTPTQRHRDPRIIRAARRTRLPPPPARSDPTPESAEDNISMEAAQAPEQNSASSPPQKKKKRRRRKADDFLMEDAAAMAWTTVPESTSFTTGKLNGKPDSGKWYFQAPGQTSSYAGDCGVISCGTHLIFIDTGTGTMYDLVAKQLNSEWEQCTDFIFITTHWHADHTGKEGALRTKLMKLCSEQTGFGIYQSASAPRAAAASTPQTERFGGKNLSMITCKTLAISKEEVLARPHYMTFETPLSKNTSWEKNVKKRTLQYSHPESHFEIDIYDMGKFGDCGNKTSLGVRIQVKDWILLSLGDMEVDKQEKMWQLHEKVLSQNADVIKLAHHGSSGNFFPELLRLKPRGRLLSSGHTLKWESKDGIWDNWGDRSVTLCLLMDHEKWEREKVKDTLNGDSMSKFRALCGSREIYNDGILLEIGAVEDEDENEDEDGNGRAKARQRIEEKPDAEEAPDAQRRTDYEEMVRARREEEAVEENARRIIAMEAAARENGESGEEKENQP